MGRYVITVKVFKENNREQIAEYHKKIGELQENGLHCLARTYMVKWSKSFDCTSDEDAQKECDRLYSLIKDQFDIDKCFTSIRKIAQKRIWSSHEVDKINLLKQEEYLAKELDQLRKQIQASGYADISQKLSEIIEIVWKKGSCGI